MTIDTRAMLMLRKLLSWKTRALVSKRNDEEGFLGAAIIKASFMPTAQHRIAGVICVLDPALTAAQEKLFGKGSAAVH